MSFTIDQVNEIKAINLISTILSLIGELFIIFCYYLIPSARSFSMKLVVSLVYSDLAYSIANLMTLVNSNPIVCFIEGYLRTAAVISGSVWVIVMLWVSYSQTKKFRPDIHKIFTKSLIINLFIANIPSLTTTILQNVNGTAYFWDELIFC